MAHPNEELLRRMEAAQAQGDLQTMFAAFTDDVVGHFGGRSGLAGDYKGKEQLQELFGRFLRALGENPRDELHDLVAGDDHGIKLHTWRAERHGERIAIRQIDIFHFADGKIGEAWFVGEDPYSADAWFDAGLSS